MRRILGRVPCTPPRVDVDGAEDSMGVTGWEPVATAFAGAGGWDSTTEATRRTGGRAVAAAEEDETENWAMVRGEYATFREEFRKLGEDVTQGIKTLGAAMDEWLAEADEGENSSDDGLEMEMESMSGDVEMEHMDGMEDHEEDVAMAEGV